jgi:hypothetical protein
MANEVLMVWQAFTNRTASRGLEAGPRQSEEEPGLPRKSLIGADGDEASIERRKPRLFAAFTLSRDFLL